jgi:hypothetical protein
VSYIIAKDGELPENLEKKVWNRPVEGLLITSGLTLVVANSFDLSHIATMGSSGFLLIFAAVNASAARLALKIAARRWISITGAVVCIVALAVLISHKIMTSPDEIWVLIAMVGLAFTIEVVYRITVGRKIVPKYKEPF